MLQILISFLLAFIVASFVEYWLHRLMHIDARFGRDIISHYEHHRKNSAQGVIPEFRDYSAAIPIALFSFLVSIPVGVSFISGTIVYGIFAAYAHQLQHENPTKCFWLAMPVHYVHHKYNQWDYNFGLAVDWWDKVFGTYKAMDWLTEEELEIPEKGHLQVKWW